MKHDSDLPKNDWDKTYIPIPRFFFALVFLSFTIYLIPGLWGAPLNKISGLLPPYGTQEYTGAKNSSISNSTATENNTYTIKPTKYVAELINNESAAAKNAGLEAFFDYDEALAAAKEQNKPLMIDFTGIVCPNCREFENRVWTIPEVMDRMKNKFIVASLFEDFNKELPDVEKIYSPELGATLQTVGDKFKALSLQLTGGISQPNYVFLYPNGSKIIDKGYGYDDVQKNGVMDFAKHLDSVLTLFKKNNHLF
jgi:thiol:disulfide interchange protein DsbD